MPSSPIRAKISDSCISRTAPRAPSIAILGARSRAPSPEYRVQSPAMKAPLALAAAVILCSASAASLSAQWPKYPEPGVPRTADGKVDVNAPAPKFFDGHPDLSGVWENPGWSEGAAAGGSVSGTGGAPGTRSAENRRPPAPSIAAFFDLGTLVQGGLPYQPWARELRNQRAADG